MEKAFLQIEFDEADRDMLRFLWVKSIENINLEHFETFLSNFLKSYLTLNGLDPLHKELKFFHLITQFF